MTIKIDLENAYDRLSWPFIRDTLENVGIPRKWINNISYCVEMLITTILWNGKQLDWFKPPQAFVRVHESISPYLFELYLERLGHIIHNYVDNGKWKPIRQSRHGPNLSHLFFADDLILFAEASVEQI